MSKIIGWLLGIALVCSYACVRSFNKYTYLLDFIANQFFMLMFFVVDICQCKKLISNRKSLQFFSFSLGFHAAIKRFFLSFFFFFLFHLRINLHSVISLHNARWFRWMHAKSAYFYSFSGETARMRRRNENQRQQTKRYYRQFDVWPFFNRLPSFTQQQRR